MRAVYSANLPPEPTEADEQNFYIELGMGMKASSGWSAMVPKRTPTCHSKSEVMMIGEIINTISRIFAAAVFSVQKLISIFLAETHIGSTLLGAIKC